MTNGIDISQWQGNVDFSKVKSSGVDFVILRAGYGKTSSQKDPTFEQNYARAKAAGLPVGVYWYSYATNSTTTRLEAEACLEVIKGKTFEYPIYFDLEEQSAFKTGMANCSQMVTAFCETLEKAGYFAGLYISRSPLQSYITNEVASRYALWIAEYSTKCNYSGKYGMWQYSSTGKVGGISGNVDKDYCYIDYPTLIKSAGLNGFEKPKKPTETLDTSGYKKGDKNLCILAIKQLLIKQGYKLDDTQGFGSGTENAVNELLTKWGYVPNGIIGEGFVRKITK